ncbi:hypothetical protein IAU59_006771 [Kwoniella sp. CBS 9459]
MTLTDELTIIYRAFGGGGSKDTVPLPPSDARDDQARAHTAQPEAPVLSMPSSSSPNPTSTSPALPLSPTTPAPTPTTTTPLEPWSSRRVDPEKARKVFNEIAERRIGEGEISREELGVLLETGDRGIRHGKIAGYTSAALSTLYFARKWRRIGVVPSILGIMGAGALGAVVVGLGSSVWSYRTHYGMLKDWDEDTIDRKWRILEEINAEAGEKAKPSWQQRQRYNRS